MNEAHVPVLAVWGREGVASVGGGMGRVAGFSIAMYSSSMFAPFRQRNPVSSLSHSRTDTSVG